MLIQLPKTYLFSLSDYDDVTSALAAMKDIAAMINARRSRIEGLEALVRCVFYIYYVVCVP
jgi:hypothetical protein